MSERAYLLDASALLALFLQEDGWGKVEQVLGAAAISAVNLAEVVGKLHDRGASRDTIALNVADANLRVLVFDEPTAIRAAELRQQTRKLGLSLADRACLATAEASGRVVITADRAWSGLALGIAIEFIR